MSTPRNAGSTQEREEGSLLPANPNFKQQKKNYEHAAVVSCDGRPRDRCSSWAWNCKMVKFNISYYLFYRFSYIIC